jgi:hypothetical protein
MCHSCILSFLILFHCIKNKYTVFPSQGTLFEINLNKKSGPPCVLFKFTSACCSCQNIAHPGFLKTTKAGPGCNILHYLLDEYEKM